MRRARGCLPAGCLTAFAAVALFGGAAYATITETHHVCTVESKDRATKGEKSSMRVYTTQCGVLEVTDTLWRFKWDAADRYAAIREGRTYDFTTVGFRLPILSIFPNIIETKEANR